MRRWLILVGILALATTGAFLVADRFQRPYRQWRQFERVCQGMTKEEVVALMGSEYYEYAWRSPDSTKAMVYPDHFGGEGSGFMIVLNDDLLVEDKWVLSDTNGFSGVSEFTPSR